MRTLALAQEARSRGIAVEYVILENELVRLALERRGFAAHLLHQASESAWPESLSGNNAIVFDGYHFDDEDFRPARATGARLGVIDDGPGRGLLADAVLNQSALRASYEVPEGATVLVGPAHALIREEFRVRRRERPSGTNRLGLMLGGSDVSGLSTILVGLLGEGHPFHEVVLFEGPAAKRWTGESPPWLSIVRDPVDIGEALDSLDAVVSTAGVSTWELLAMGLPAALVLVAENQRPVIESVLATEAALVVGEAKDVEHRLRSVVHELAQAPVQEKLNQAGLQLVDGRGVERFLSALFH